MSIDGVEINLGDRLPKVSRRRIKNAVNFKTRKSGITPEKKVTQPEPEIVQDSYFDKINTALETAVEPVPIPAEVQTEEQFVEWVNDVPVDEPVEVVQNDEVFTETEQPSELNIENSIEEPVIQAEEIRTLTLEVPQDTVGTIDVTVDYELIEIKET